MLTESFCGESHRIQVNLNGFTFFLIFQSDRGFGYTRLLLCWLGFFRMGRGSLGFAPLLAPLAFSPVRWFHGGPLKQRLPPLLRIGLPSAVFLPFCIGIWTNPCFSQVSTPSAPVSTLMAQEFTDELHYLREETVLTPNYQEQPISEAPSNVYVITEADIRKSGRSSPAPNYTIRNLEQVCIPRPLLGSRNSCPCFTTNPVSPLRGSLNGDRIVLRRVGRIGSGAEVLLVGKNSGS